MFKFAAKKVLVSREETEDLDMNQLDAEDDNDHDEAFAAESGDVVASQLDSIPVTETMAAPRMMEPMMAPPMMETMAGPPPMMETAAAPTSEPGFFSRLFSSARGAAAAPPPPPAPHSEDRVRHRRAPIRKPRPLPPQSANYRAADTNIFALALGSLASDAHLISGEIVKCSNCHAAFSNISKLQAAPAGGAASSTADEGARVWVCEFCEHPQTVDLVDEERPTAETNDYLIEPPSAASEQQNIIVFVLDISGSMCVTTEVQGSIQLKGVNGLDKFRRELNEDVGAQWMPGQRQDVTYISRLQAAQAAIAQQIASLKRDHPNSRVALITFSNEVTVIGDGMKEPVTIAGDRLNDFNGLLTTGQGLEIEHPVSESAEGLDSYIWSLQEGGSTALGPAALVAVGMASKAPSSKVIICTDGLANVGVGSLDGASSDEEKETLRQWYEQVGNLAKSAGTSISVVSIAGSGCCMEYLGIFADMSQGNVDIVQATDLVSNFSSLLSTPTIATQVQATLLLHKALFIRSDGDSLSSTAVRDIGNVNGNSEVTFEFGVRPEFINKIQTAPATQLPSAVPRSSPAAAPTVESSAPAPAAAAPVQTPSEVPFQVQVSFRKLDGSRMLRIVTALQPISFDRHEVEETVDIDVLGRNAMQKCADLMQQGEYEKAQLHNIANRRLMSRATKEKSSESAAGYFRAQEQLYSALQGELLSEQAAAPTLAVPSASPAPAPYSVSSLSPSSALKKTRMNRRMESDATSNMMYQMKSHSSPMSPSPKPQPPPSG
jgi:Mg-chelatase subunit ChlD